MVFFKVIVLGAETAHVFAESADLARDRVLQNRRMPTQIIRCPQVSNVDNLVLVSRHHTDGATFRYRPDVADDTAVHYRVVPAHQCRILDLPNDQAVVLNCDGQVCNGGDKLILVAHWHLMQDQKIVGRYGKDSDMQAPQPWQIRGDEKQPVATATTNRKAVAD